MEKNKKRWLISICTIIFTSLCLLLGKNLLSNWCRLFFNFIISIDYRWYIILFLIVLIFKKPSKRQSLSKPKPKSIKNKKFEHNGIIYEYSFPEIDIIYERCSACNTILYEDKCPKCGYDYRDYYEIRLKRNPKFNIDDCKTNQEIIYLIENFENNRQQQYQYFFQKIK
jgi:hypothetical protein